MSRYLSLIAFVFACGGESSKKPSGTTADPVEVCERVADVCRYKGSQLGVCVRSEAGNTFVCQPQH